MSKVSFVLASCDHGTMIVNRNDHHMLNSEVGYGVGHQILERSAYDPDEIALLKTILQLRRLHFGDGVVAIDGGANIGVHTIEWARVMRGWGSVIAVEAQERIYYALCGNIALANASNAVALLAALSDHAGTMQVPTPNYDLPASYGSLEMKKTDRTENIGQAIDYEKCSTRMTLLIDDLDLARVDLIKLDIEGMEMEALNGAKATIEKCLPVLFIEHIKVSEFELRAWLNGFGYKIFDIGSNLVAIHPSDKTLEHVAKKA